MSMRNKLEWEADRLEAVLAVHNLPARVTGGTVTPRWVRFQVLPAVGAKISKIKGLHEELAAALDVSTCRVSRRGAALAIEVPRDDPQPVRLLPLYQQMTEQGTPIPPVTAILGLAEDGAPLLIRLPSPDVAHILIAGTTGSGKTVLLQTMILSLAMSNEAEKLKLVLVDPKHHAFSPFAGMPHLARPVIWEVEEAVEALRSLTRLMDIRPMLTPHDKTARVIIFIDELADLLMTGGKPVQRALTRLTQRGREAGIHIVAATQKPTAAVLGPLIKANFPVRLVGRVTCAEDARTASGWSSTGAERLTGQGDFLAVAEGRVSHFQVAHVTPKEIRDIVASLPGYVGGECSRPPRSQAVTAGNKARLPLPAPVNRLISLPWPTNQPSVFHQPEWTNPSLEPKDNGNLALAQVLIDSNLWEKRQHADRADDYRWGWPTAVCQMLFNQPLVGNWHSRTVHIIQLAEEISNSTTSNGKKGPGNSRNRSGA